MMAPINLYYDVTPTGVVLNRFSKDLGAVDNEIFRGIRLSFDMLYNILSVLFVIATVNVYALAVVPVMGYVILRLYRILIPAFRESQRIIQVSSSPIINHVSETYSGNSTIRAFGNKNQFLDKNYELFDQKYLAMEIMWGQWNWFGVRMNVVSIIFMICGVSSCILFRNSENKIMLALVLSSVLDLNHHMLHGIYMIGQVEKSMINVQRCFELLKIPQEQ